MFSISFLPKRSRQTVQTKQSDQGLTNSSDPDKTASKEAVWSGSALFAILTSILWITALKTNILHVFEKRYRKSVQFFRMFTLNLIIYLVVVFLGLVFLCTVNCHVKHNPYPMTLNLFISLVVVFQGLVFFCTENCHVNHKPYQMTLFLSE